MPLATLSIDLEAKLANLEAGMDKAARIAEKNARATEAAWQRAGAVMTGIAGTLAGAFAGFSLVEFVKSNVDAIDALNDVADATGASIENISALDELARRTGTTLDVVTSALIKLNGGLNDAKPDSPVALALRGIGLEVDKLKALDPAEALRVVAVALSGYADDGNKARLTQELFGKSLREVAPLLKDLAEQTSLVGKRTKEQADEAEKFNKQLFELQANVSNATRALTSELVPAFNQLFDAIQGKEVGGDSAINDLIVVPLQAVTVLGANVAFVLKGIGTEIGGMAAQAAALLSLDFKGFSYIGQELTADAKRSREEFDKLEKRLMSIGTVRASSGVARVANADALPSVGALSVGDKTNGSGRGAKQAEQISEAQRALAQYVGELQRELDKVNELSEAQATLNFLKSLDTVGEVPQVRELVLGMQQQITLRKQDAAIRADVLRISKEQQAAEKALADELYRISGRADVDRRSALMSQLLKQQDAGESFSPEELDKIFDEITGKLKPKLEEMDELMKQFGRNVQDSLGETLKRTLKGDFDNIGDLWANLLLDMAAQAAAAQLGKQLFGAEFFKGGDLGGLAKTALAFFGIPGFAAGGDHIGGLRIVGENGPELEATGPARIFDAGQTQQILRGGGGGGKAVQVNYSPVYQIDSRSDRAAVMADAQALDRRSQADLLQLLKAKGVI